MTKFGETDGLNAENFITIMEKYLGENVLDYALFNEREPAPNILRRYEREHAEFIAPPKTRLGTGKIKYVITNLIGNGKLMRHGPRKKVAEALLGLL
jgi:2-phospho-L-lactate transferase/gluconeogenesis factor (CofD/UPF0052 family)